MVEIPSCCVDKFDDGGNTSWSVDEVLITLVNMVLSWIGAEIGWVHGVVVVSTTNSIEYFSELDDIKSFLGEWVNEGITTATTFFGLVSLIH